MGLDNGHCQLLIFSKKGFPKAKIAFFLLFLRFYLVISKKSSTFALAFGLGSAVWSIKHNFFARCSAVAGCVKGDEGEMGEWLKPPVC